MARRRNSKRKLETSLAGALPETRPGRLLRWLWALLLLAPAWILTQTFFGAFAWITVTSAFWATEEFWFFSLGCVLWCVIFFSLPRPLWIYVFGHELTHALWAWFMGGRVAKIHVSSEGGHILTDRVNIWIALAPYFFPIYSILVLAAYLLAGLFTDVSQYDRWLFVALGFTWAFHFFFTCWMIPKGQSDLAYGGTFFSLVLIYIANLVVLSILLIAGSPELSIGEFFGALEYNTRQFVEFCLWAASRLSAFAPL